jgi:uncharacterized protein YbjT (DUF2867 family)
MSGPKHDLKQKEFFCADLPTKPVVDMGKVLVAGASGYIGSKLISELLARGYKVKAMVRSNPHTYQSQWPAAEVVVADALNIESLRSAFDGVDVVYYLIHSLCLGPKKFESTDLKAADNFAQVAKEKNVKRIIYLGGLGDVRSHLSHHLSSRIDVAIRLIMGKVPVTVVRAAIIIGAGSASYEMIYHLIKNLPLLLVPPWARTKCQPISVSDVLKYLVGILETPETAGHYFDIGGKDVLTYRDMLSTLSGLLTKKTLFIPVPFSNTAFYSYFSSLLTPTPYPLIRCLMESLQNDVVCLDESIKGFIPFEPIS